MHTSTWAANRLSFVCIGYFTFFLFSLLLLLLGWFNWNHTCVACPIVCGTLRNEHTGLAMNYGCSNIFVWQLAAADRLSRIVLDSDAEYKFKRVTGQTESIHDLSWGIKLRKWKKKLNKIFWIFVRIHRRMQLVGQQPNVNGRHVNRS